MRINHIANSFAKGGVKMRRLLRAVLSISVLIIFLVPCYAADDIDVSLSWDYEDTTEGVKFRIFKKLTTETEYDYSVPIWDSKDGENPSSVREATVTVPGGQTYNFVARAYLFDEEENKDIESDDSNEVEFEAPVFAINGVVLDSFTNSEIYENPVYYGSTGEDIQISWKAVNGAEEYEFRLYDVNRKYNVIQGNTSDPKATFKLPRTGTYEFEIRARKSSSYTSWKKFDARISGWISGVGPIVIE